MSIFQSSVVTKHLKTQNKEKITIQWELFKNHFHNPAIQENIRNSKEEQYQGEFLIDLFVNVLGYIKSPTPNFNITTEYKNVKDSKKADGAIIVADVVKAVIELKGTNTTDLGKIEVQAFGYKNNQVECNYVITSNFEKLRFYIDNAIEHIEFNLFTLTEKDFELLYLCLAYENIEKNIPKKLKEESLSQEDAITKKLYNDYSLFKRELHQSLVILNPQFDALTLFQKSQKLLDRFLFLFFAEDRQLLPPNSVRLILDQWQKLKELDAYTPLFDRFKKYFGYLNTGHKGKQYDVYAYNGGLFLPDEVLDTITIDDDLLYKHTLKLSDYDFISEVDVNILGHIFENSLNELDEIKALLEGKEVDKSKTKRKKDGVFYTPKYITKYIVENTVGKLCEEKRPLTPKGGISPKLPKKEKQKYFEELKDYRKWLLQLTICDPACGSGAFLNQALDFLISEHRYIDELQAKLFGDAMVLSDVEKNILENNLFGVDLNEESVEIAKLSLWLRTAQPNRKLNDLSNNIKCGNSLIDDVSVAGDKAFDWQKEFPQIFKEKNKKAFHITTAVHDSRTSERMIDYKVREKRDLGTNPYPNIIYFTEEDEFVITQTIANIVKEDNLNVLAYNICGDHIHLLLVCEEEKITKIVQKIKSITSKNCTQNRKMEHDSVTMEHAPLPNTIAMAYGSATMEHAPLPDTKKQTPLWTQKFGCKEITNEEHLFTAIDYIKHNRSKHSLPEHNKDLKLLIENFVCDYNHAFRDEYYGGFDVVIGNPPYGVNFNEDEKKYLSNFDSLVPDFEIYIYFISLYKKILKSNSVLSYIFPNTFLSTLFGIKYREEIFKKVDVYQIIDLSNDNTFIDAAVRTCIFSFKNSRQDYTTALLKIENREFKAVANYSKESIINEVDNILSLFSQNKKEKLIIQKIQKNKKLKEFFEVSQGLIPYDKYRGHDEYTIKNRIWHSDFQKDETYKKELKGGDVNRYNINWNGNLWISYGDWLAAPRNKKYFTSKRVLVREITADKLFCGYTNDEFYNTPSAINIIDEKGILSLKYSLTLLNSKLIGWLHNKVSPKANKGLFPKILVNDVRIIPLVEISINSQQPFIEKANLMLSLNKELQILTQKFQRAIEREFFDKGFKPLANAANSLSKKLQDWYLLSFGDFIKELEKKKVKLSLSQKAEWEDYFLQESKKALELKNKIDTTDKEIDAMVYELYGLTKEEIEIVENTNS
jgi:REP element-mobilizing transposase RayT